MPFLRKYINASRIHLFELKNDSVDEYQTILISRDILTLLTTTLSGNRFVPKRARESECRVASQPFDVRLNIRSKLAFLIRQHISHAVCFYRRIVAIPWMEAVEGRLDGLGLRVRL